jgi:nucleoside-diphosphate-sugar epimerase
VRARRDHANEPGRQSRSHNGGLILLRLLIFGFGYSGRATAVAARAAGFEVAVTSRTPAVQKPETGVEIIHFEDAEQKIEEASHILSTAAPGERGDPALVRYGAQIAVSSAVWMGYFSTTGVYGNRDGGWVDEESAPAPHSERAKRRVEAEAAWRDFDGQCAVDIFRLAGIYGPGRSMIDDLREGSARRVLKPGHLFGRIHRDDIALGVVAAMKTAGKTGVRVFNFSDDEPAASADVVVEAARLLGVEPPAPVSYEEAAPKMSAMGLSFWAENRKVANAKTKTSLGISWRYPSYREGLAGILAEERGEGLG